MTRQRLEICVDDASGLETATAAGADRIELCSALGLGGLTPSVALMTAAARTAVPTYAMIRPRAGDFIFAEPEIRLMEADIAQARASGLSGVVLGASLPDGRLDAETLQRLIGSASGLEFSLHRAFDLVPDFAEALELAITLGFRRILTSGGAKTAFEGIDTISWLAARAGDRISIMPGGGVNKKTAPALLAIPGIRELHSAGAVPIPEPDSRVLRLGFDAPGRKITNRTRILGIRAALGTGTEDAK